MILLDIDDVVRLHEKVVNATGGTCGIRDAGGLASSIRNAYMTFDGRDLYPTIEEKVSITCFSIISNHPFVDGNKRTGIYVMLILLQLNGIQLRYTQEELISLGLDTAKGSLNKEDILAWIYKHTV
jgi:death-on-curing protein